MRVPFCASDLACDRATCLRLQHTNASLRDPQTSQGHLDVNNAERRDEIPTHEVIKSVAFLVFYKTLAFDPRCDCPTASYPQCGQLMVSEPWDSSTTTLAIYYL